MAEKNRYWFSEDGHIGYGLVRTGEVFMFDAEDYPKIKDVTWYRCNSGEYIGDSSGLCIHRIILNAPAGFEIDHINHNPLDNRKTNLRLCTHRQNQCNQPLQRNNTSGITGVSYYSPRQKYRARIKCFHLDIHLGNYPSLLEAVQARNEGMLFLFGEFGVYNNVPEAPPNIKQSVKDKCSRVLNEPAVFI